MIIPKHAAGHGHSQQAQSLLLLDQHPQQLPLHIDLCPEVLFVQNAQYGHGHSQHGS